MVEKLQLDNINNMNTIEDLEFRMGMVELDRNILGYRLVTFRELAKTWKSKLEKLKQKPNN